MRGDQASAGPGRDPEPGRPAPPGGRLEGGPGPAERGPRPADAGSKPAELGARSRPTPVTTGSPAAAHSFMPPAMLVTRVESGVEQDVAALRRPGCPTAHDHDVAVLRHLAGTRRERTERQQRRVGDVPGHPLVELGTSSTNARRRASRRPSRRPPPAPGRTTGRPWGGRRAQRRLGLGRGRRAGARGDGKGDGGRRRRRVEASAGHGQAPVRGLPA